jgi:hypothetical protein
LAPRDRVIREEDYNLEGYLPFPAISRFGNVLFV